MNPLNGTHHPSPTFASSGLNNLDFLKFRMKSDLLSSVSTGNMILDTIIAFIVLSLYEYLSGSLGNVKSFIFTLPFRFYRFTAWLYYVLSGTEKVRKYADIKFITDGKEINSLFEPMMWYINTISDKKKEDFVSLESTKTNPEVLSRIPESRTSTFLFLEHEFTFSVRKELITIYGKQDQKRENYIIDLYVDVAKNRPNDIFTQLSETSIKKYEEFSQKRVWSQLIFRNEKDTWKSKKSKTSRKTGTVILKKGQMDDLVDDVNDFLQKEEWYISRDVPYTRRYMFWGSPGTGKSSCIKALASHTKRHIHYLVLSEVESDSMLFKLMENIDHSTTILVIEDIDCASKIVQDREKLAELALPPVIDDKSNKDIIEKKGKENRLTLSGLLNAIDGGMIENHGQILIMTTNHPECLDPALTRPGRVDMKIEFGKCDNFQIEGLFYNFFERSPPFEHKFPDSIISPAEITSIFLQYKKNPEEAWNMAVEKFKNIKKALFRKSAQKALFKKSAQK